jgi:uncharacterized protein Yka (UPF0111/DUF47 family)
MLAIFTRDAGFFDLFDELADHVVSCAEHFRELVIDFPRNQAEFGRIHEEEQQADNVSHRIVDRLNHAFLPPIDGDDVHALAGGLDDIIDYIDEVATRLPVYHVDAVDPNYVRQAEVLVQAAKRVNDAVHQLRRSRRLSDLGDTLIEIHRQESIGDDNYHAALSRLFDGTFQPLFVLKWKELHSLVEQAIDACEDVGNILERIVLKNA